MPPPPPIEPESADSADGSKAEGRKRPRSKPTIRLHDGVIDTDSATPTHMTRGDNLNPHHLYAPTS